MERVTLKLQHFSKLFLSTRGCLLQHQRPLVTRSNIKAKTVNIFDRHLRCHKNLNHSKIQPFQTSSRRPVNPLILLMLKMRVTKGITLLVTRFLRKRYAKLPKEMQIISRSKIAMLILFVSFNSIAYYTYQHYGTTPITGRKRWIVFTKEQAVAIADETHKELMEEYEGNYLPEDHPLYQRCDQVLQEILKSNLDIEQFKGTNWHINVVDGNILNAFVLPNGEIYIFTEMLNFLQSKDELAVLLGHEITHALLGHSQEQHTYLMLGELLLIPILSFIWFMFDDIVASIAHIASKRVYSTFFKIGFDLPKSREMESEADMVGLKLISKACMDPRYGVLLWDRMNLIEEVESLVPKEEDSSRETKELEKYFSTHPPSHQRALEIEENMPLFISLRKDCNCDNLPAWVDPLRAAQEMRKYSTIIRSQMKLKSEIAKQESSKDEGTRLVMMEKQKELERLNKLVSKEELQALIQ